MHIPSLEPRRTRVTLGTVTKLHEDPKLQHLASSHPFTQQLDVVFPVSDALRHDLATLNDKHGTCQTTLIKFIEDVKPFIHEISMTSNVIALGQHGPLSDDTWCLDSRGLLTLAVGKETYQHLGLVGAPLPWKECKNTFIIHISLLHAQARTHESKTLWHIFDSKTKASLAVWDALRDPWTVVFTYSESGTPLNGSHVSQIIQPVTRTLEGVHIPTPTVFKSPDSSAHGMTSSDGDTWKESILNLFEWVGMACLASQRLQINDRLDPYVAVYTPPDPSHTGDIVHMKWQGLLSPSFVKQVIDTIGSRVAPSTLVSVTASCVPTSPVSYVPPPSTPRTPRRAPRDQSEDTWSLVLFRCDGLSVDDTLNFALAESIGQWDERWG